MANKYTTITITKELHARIKAIADAEFRTVAAVVGASVQAYLDRNRKGV